MGKPETFGFVIVGATIGAVACGAGTAGLTLHALTGAAAGALVVPAVIVTRWIRLRRLIPSAQNTVQS